MTLFCHTSICSRQAASFNRPLRSRMPGGSLVLSPMLINCADLSLSGTTDAQALPGPINPTHRKIRGASAGGAYDTRDCHDALLRKKKSGHSSRREAVRNTVAGNTMNVTTWWRISI